MLSPSGGVGHPWEYDQLAGRLVELSGRGAAAPLTLAFRKVVEAQQRAEPVAWVTDDRVPFYPPDASANGVDLDALPVVFAADAPAAARAAEKLGRSGAFGHVVLDLRGRRVDLPLPLQTRLASLAKAHDMILLCLTEKGADQPSLGSLVSLRCDARRGRLDQGRFVCQLQAVKDKRQGPGWRLRNGALDRLACVDVPALPLQLLLRRHPEWKKHPAVVVAEDRPQAEILWVNERARRVRVLPGVRYAAALSLCRELRAGVVTSTEIQAGVQEIAGTLRDFTPDVEPYKSDPGTFWADLKGLERLFDSASAWARAVRSAIERLGFRVALALGFTRFGSYASAKDRLESQESCGGGWTHIFRTLDEEKQRMRSVPLERLVLAPRLRESLARLGVRTVGALIDLPAAGLLERYGPEAYRLHQLAAGKTWSPLAVQAAELRRRRS